MLILYLAIGIAGCLAIFFVCWYIFDYTKDYKGRSVGKIAFDRFLTLYRISPDHWFLHNGYVEYDNYYDDWSVEKRYARASFYFPVIDTLRYQSWRKNKYKKNEAERNNKRYRDVLICIQDDIQKYQSNS